MYSIKPSGYRVKIRFDKDLLAVKQINYFTKFVNVFIVYDLDNCDLEIPLRNFTKKLLVGATTIVKNSNKGKWG